MAPDTLLDQLTEPQRAAVTHADGPLLVLAGPGSGKTRVITHRAAYLAGTVARPDRILAITFTNKAAEEMRQRIGALGIGGRMWVCTFHALCARLLRQYGHAIDIKPNFSILDEVDRRALIREAIINCRLNTDNWHPRTVQVAISDAKNRLLTPETLAEEACDFSDKAVARIYKEYQQLVTVQNGCDFDDLLMHAATLLGEHESIRAELSDRFRYLLIDEYQDTNHAQYLIANRLAEAHRNICATGDPDQSIYAWRGADIQNILNFEADYPEATTIRLEQNYRSVGAILSAASSLIAKNFRRKHKELWTQNESGPAVRVWACEDEHCEAAQIAEDIHSYCDDGGQAGDVAVFYRINALTRVLEEELRRLNLPYQIARGVEFYGRKEIKDVLAYLRAIVNPADELAIVRAINTPARGIGKVTIGRLRATAQANDVAIGQAIADAAANAALKSMRKKIEPFARLMTELRALPQHPVRDLVEAVITLSGIEAALGKEGDIDSEPIANVYELVNAAHQYDQDHPDGSLGEWLHQICLVSDIDTVELSGGPVTLMTLHAAKGLEFPVVYIVGLEEGLLPHRRAIHGDQDALEEERRLCFVGMTRAKHRLTLANAKYRMIRGVTERTAASRFIRELPADEISFQTFEVERDRSTAHLGRYNEYERLSEAMEFLPGQRVRHPEYDDGTVLELERRGRSVYIRVLFDDHGKRSFALEHASLVIVEH
jgi:DNA helicase-2/ATP-dependent DNA helicase PcrA